MTRLPDGVYGMAGRSPAWADWVDRLPGLIESLLAEWGLRTDGWFMHGYTSLAAPVVRGDGSPAMLKVTFDGDDESELEHLALQRWGGRGAVRLLRADPSRRALLLERLETRDLSQEWDVAACETVAGLYSRLHVPALPQLRSLSSYVGPWLDDLAALPADAPVPHRLVQQAVGLGRDLLAEPGRALIHGDLHYTNVLAAPAEQPGRSPWLAIDPKPMAGDPYYEPAPMLWNRFEELVDHPMGVRRGIRQRFHALIDRAGMDEDRARDWVVVRAMTNVSWQLVDPRHRLTEHERSWITRCITIAKAVQD